ncbi:MAG: peptide chain release factor N(5)-glutamine methyltransferase [Thermoanaerobacteraceae bacterium]|nr:peptide chain release factor N(5)-glutamine methyltransferase [Thermoanaerobacteraceae bacterium]
MTLFREALREGTYRLERVGIDTARLDAEVLLAHACRINRAKLLSRMNEEIPLAGLELFFKYIKKRETRYPISYITGHKDFMGLDFMVSEGVLIPRPETEILVETVMNILPEDAVVIDLCTGSGVVAVSLAHYLYDATLYAVDISEAACCTAEQNAERIGVKNRVKVFKGDLFEPLPEDLKSDAVVSNPPYIKTKEIDSLMPEILYEPIEALDGGNSGIEFYKRIVDGAACYLKSNGVLAFEIGYDEVDDVVLLMERDYRDIKVIKDMAGMDRVVVGRFRN